MAQIDSYGSKPGGLEGSEIFIFASTTETYNCTLAEIATYVKADIHYLSFNTTQTKPTYQAGLFFYDPIKKSLAYYNENSEMTVNISQENIIRVYNETGVDIPNGKVVYPDHVVTVGGNDEIAVNLASARVKRKALLVGVTTTVIPDEGFGYVTKFGEVGGLNTAEYTSGLIYLSDTPGEMTQTAPTDGSYRIVLGAPKVIHATEGSIEVDIVSTDTTVEVSNKNGFAPEQAANITLVGDAGTRTFTISSSSYPFHFYQYGEKYEKATLETVVWSDVEGNIIIYYDLGVLTSQNNPTASQIQEIIVNKTIVSMFYWDATNKQLIPDVGNELHGLSMSSFTHAYLHNHLKAQYSSGFALGNFINDASGALNTHAQFSVEDGVYDDEDISHTGGASPVGTTIPVLFLSGATGYLRKGTTSNFAVLTTGTGRLAYNQWTGTTWQTSEVTNNNFVLYHIFAVNGFTQRVISAMGQAQYNTKTAARAGASTEIASLKSQLPLAEILPLATIIYQTSDSYTNTVKARTISTDTGGTYVDWRTTPMGQGANPSDHNNLTNLQYANTGVSWGHINDQTQTIYGIKTFNNSIISPNTYFDATIGTGGDYAEPQDAFTAGKTRLKFLSNVTITKATTCSAFCIIDLNGFTLTFTGQTFTLTAGTTISGNLIGNLSISNNSVNLNKVTLTGTLTLIGDYITITECDISGVLTLNSGSEYNDVSNNRLRSGYTDNSSSLTNRITNNI